MYRVKEFSTSNALFPSAISSLFSVVFVIFVCVVLRFTNHSSHTAVTILESEERMVEENCVIYLFVCSGPASVLFEKSYYELMKAALRSGGIICSQGI